MLAIVAVDADDLLDSSSELVRTPTLVPRENFSLVLPDASILAHSPFVLCSRTAGLDGEQPPPMSIGTTTLPPRDPCPPASRLACSSKL